jgi:hypothetical protein
MNTYMVLFSVFGGLLSGDGLLVLLLLAAKFPRGLAAAVMRIPRL